MTLGAALQTLTNGLLLGAVYVAMAMGLSLTMGVLGLVNVAHSAFLILASLVTWQLVNVAGLDPFLAAALVLPAFFLLGAAVERSLLVRVAREPVTTGLLVLFGVMVIVESAAILYWTTDSRQLDLGYLAGTLHLGPVSVPVARLAGGLMALAAVGALHLFLQRTLTGRAIRGMAQNSDAARMLGIPVERLRMVVFGLGTALAALGGVALAMAFAFSPQEHVRWLAWSFLIVVLGGLGSVRNTVLAGFLVGLIEAFAGVLVPFEYVYFIVYGLLALVLLLRSEGLAGARARTI